TYSRRTRLVASASGGANRRGRSSMTDSGNDSARLPTGCPFPRWRRVFALSAFWAWTWLLIASAPAQAHPHVWVTMQSTILYGTDGKVTGVRHAWSFDDMFSAF